MRMTRSKVLHRNRSSYGWWIASYILRFQFSEENSENPNRRCLAWENTVLVKAKNREGAYRKALRIGRDNEGLEESSVRGRKGTWRFDGLTSLLPIYEELEDGCEILWREHDGRSVKTIRNLVKSKSQLEAFDDEEA